MSGRESTTSREVLSEVVVPLHKIRCHCGLSLQLSGQPVAVRAFPVVLSSFAAVLGISVLWQFSQEDSFLLQDLSSLFVNAYLSSFLREKVLVGVFFSFPRAPSFFRNACRNSCLCGSSLGAFLCVNLISSCRSCGDALLWECFSLPSSIP